MKATIPQSRTVKGANETTRSGPASGRHYFLRPVNSLPPEVERRRRLLTRALPLAVLASASFIAGAATGIPPTPEKDAAKRFTEAWARGDFDAMRAELNPASRKAVGKSEFVDDYMRGAGDGDAALDRSRAARRSLVRGRRRPWCVCR